MEIKKQNEIEEKVVDMEGAKNVRMQILTKGAGNFIMRRFIVGKDGYTPLHKHEWEHEAFILKGKGIVVDEGKEIEVEQGTVIYVEPNKEHQFINKSEEPFEFICVIPSQDKSCPR
jgi:quercetin dioxygenase-like cupin family protein